MLRHPPFLLLLVLVAGSSAACKSADATSTVPQRVRISEFGWLTGRWAGENQDGMRIEQDWDEPAAGTMLGRHRGLRDTREVLFVQLRILSGMNGVVMIGSPGGDPARTYEMVDFEDGHVRFVSPSDDYPKIVELTRSGSRLRVFIGGPDGLGGVQETSYELQRSS